MLSQTLTQYAAEGIAFLNKIVTGDESCVHHYTPELKQVPME
jgi:hypothetical protein